MNQVARCPACETMFKVVADQLKIAQGWVRCGQCGELFDASLPFVPDETAVPALELAPPPEHAENAQLAPISPDEPEIRPMAAAATQNELSKPNEPNEPSGPADMQASQEVALRKIVAPKPEAAEPEAATEVSFVQDARRKEFWKKPLIRAVLGLIFLLLLSALALQWMVQQKDLLAALHPRLGPLLEALCRPLECEIRPLRRIGSLAIDSSSFSKTGPDRYRLGFVLKNNDVTALEIPALEVTLTDHRDEVLTRRVLTPGEFGALAATLGAHLELSGSVGLRVSGESPPGAFPSQAAVLPVTGYRLLAFYP